MLGIVSKKDLKCEINRVVDGEFAGEEVSEQHGEITVAGKILSSLTCENYEDVSEIYAGEESLKLKKSIGPRIAAGILAPFAFLNGIGAAKEAGNILRIKWRVGTTSTILVTLAIGRKIQKLFF